ncbi:MAG: hypothetical protein GY711_09885 [bacterium]|nr:hypothetical protein [bacterium]
MTDSPDSHGSTDRPEPGELTLLLQDGAAQDGRLFAFVYDELRACAARRMAAERAGHYRHEEDRAVDRETVEVGQHR